MDKAMLDDLELLSTQLEAAQRVGLPITFEQSERLKVILKAAAVASAPKVKAGA